MLDSLWKLSGGSGPDLDARRERAFSLYDSAIVDRDSIYRANPGLPMPWDPAQDKLVIDKTRIPQYLGKWSRTGPDCTVVKF